MIGFDAIGQGAIGELSGDVADVIIYAPVGFSLTATVVVPLVRGGGSVSPTARSVTALLIAPKILAGVQVQAPSVPVNATVVAGSIQISATVTVGSAGIAVTTTAPFFTSGKLVAVSSAAVAATKIAPFITGGKSAAPAAASIAVTGFQPGISISANIRPPAVPVAVTTAPPQIVGGNYIDARNTVTMVTPYGEIGSASIGQFSIGEGELSSRIVLMSPLVVVSAVPPFITAGKSQRPPAAFVSIAPFRPEIDGRTRKLRILAIAS